MLECSVSGHDQRDNLSDAVLYTEAKQGPHKKAAPNSRDCGVVDFLSIGFVNSACRPI